MAAATVDAVRELLAAQLGYSDPATGKADVAKLEPFWGSIIPRAMGRAETWLRNRLTTEMGLPAEDVAVWPPFLHYHTELSAFFCGAYRMGEISAEKQSALDRLDCRAEVTALTTLGGTAAARNGRSSVGNLKPGVFNRPFVGRGGLPAGPFGREN
jgi:hypothetical protein